MTSPTAPGGLAPPERKFNHPLQKARLFAPDGVTPPERKFRKKPPPHQHMIRTRQRPPHPSRALPCLTASRASRLTRLLAPRPPKVYPLRCQPLHTTMKLQGIQIHEDRISPIGRDNGLLVQPGAAVAHADGNVAFSEPPVCFPPSQQLHWQPRDAKVIITTHLRIRQEELGQFLTPDPVAAFMASMFGRLPETVRLLDAGAGDGALTAAFISRCCEHRDGVRAIDATLYELDHRILARLTETMHECERRCAAAGLRFTFTINNTDFIQQSAAQIADELFGAGAPRFDAAIANPPYRKISADSLERGALRSIGVETSNLYTAFISLIHRLLVPDGQLVAITPRSFCNGPYFRPFREDLLSNVELRRIHVFESRNAAFKGDGVLQENIIFHAIKSRKKPKEIVISSSSGENDAKIVEKKLSFSEVVHPHDTELFIHIPSEPVHAAAKVSLAGLTSDLASLGISVSTGRVVDFRLKDYLHKEPNLDTVPLLYPCHFKDNAFIWPLLKTRKPNAILDNVETRKWLVPSGIYLLTKRFTSKEERRRVVAFIFDPDAVSAKWIGFENHLNYFHANGHGLDRELALGLYAFLNSTVVDQYFRSFSGHTQVNATDLRKLSYPDLATLRKMGRKVAIPHQPQDKIDQLVSETLHVCH